MIVQNRLFCGRIFLPELLIVLRQRVAAFGAAVPEAAHHEDRQFFGSECDVGAAGDVFRVEAIAAKIGAPKSLAQNDLRFRILGAVRAHDTRDGFALWQRRAFVADVHEEILTKLVIRRQSLMKFGRDVSESHRLSANRAA